MELNSRDPECPIDWPGLDVNELHAAVRNDDETSEQDSAGNQKVISSFAVGIRAHPSADEPPPPQQTDQCSDSNHHGHPGDYPQQRQDSEHDRGHGYQRHDKDDAASRDEPRRDGYPVIARAIGGESGRGVHGGH